MSWRCLHCGFVPPEEIRNLTFDSPHGDERHIRCGWPVELEDLNEDDEE